MIFFVRLKMYILKLSKKSEKNLKVKQMGSQVSFDLQKIISDRDSKLNEHDQGLKVQEK